MEGDMFPEVITLNDTIDSPSSVNVQDKALAVEDTKIHDLRNDTSTDVIVLNDTTCSGICIQDLSESESAPEKIFTTRTKDNILLKGSTMPVSSFNIPEKSEQSSKGGITSRRSPRTPTLENFICVDSASWTKSYTSYTGSGTPESPESATLSSPIHQIDDSSDSFVVPTAIRKVLQGSPSQTPRKRSWGNSSTITCSPSLESGNSSDSFVVSTAIRKVLQDSPERICQKRFTGDSSLESALSPTPEKGDSNDSFVVPTAICEVLSNSSKRTPRKKGSILKKALSPPLESGVSSSPTVPPSICKALRASPKSTVLKGPEGSSPSRRKLCSSLEPGHSSNTLVEPVAICRTSPSSQKPTTLKRPRGLSPTLESSDSSDSLVVPAAIRKALQTSPQPSSFKRLKGSFPFKMRDKNTDPLNTSGPSPYKSQRPRYLPKNAKLFKRRRKERNRFLKEVEMLDAQFVQLPAILTSAQPVFHAHQPDKTTCILGMQTPLINVFKPQHFFATYNEVTFETKFGLNSSTLIDKYKFFPHDLDNAECKMMISLLTVTSHVNLCVSLSWVIREYIMSGKYELKWVDLKEILINLGVTKEPLEFPGGYYSIDSKPVPKVWNFKFLFTIVGLSFASWTTKNLERLLGFLVDCIFEPLLQPLLFEVSSLMRAVAKFLLRNDMTPDELMPAVNRSNLPMVCNCVIIQHLSVEPSLRPLSTSLAYRTICGLLDVEVCESVETLADVANLLADVSAVRSKTEVDDIYQLILICENLVAMSSFDAETKAFLSKLADFTERISLTYNHFENLHFIETVSRVKSLCAIDHL